VKRGDQPFAFCYEKRAKILKKLKYLNRGSLSATKTIMNLGNQNGITGVGTE